MFFDFINDYIQTVDLYNVRSVNVYRFFFHFLYIIILNFGYLKNTHNTVCWTHISEAVSFYHSGLMTNNVRASISRVRFCNSSGARTSKHNFRDKSRNILSFETRMQKTTWNSSLGSKKCVLHFLQITHNHFIVIFSNEGYICTEGVFRPRRRYWEGFFDFELNK